MRSEKHFAILRRVVFENKWACLMMDALAALCATSIWYYAAFAINNFWLNIGTASVAGWLWGKTLIMISSFKKKHNFTRRKHE